MDRKEQTRLARELNESRQALGEYRAFEFVEDGGKNIITCSKCRAELVEVWMMRKGAPLKSEITVKCAHCGDKSYVYKVDGQFSLGQVESGQTIMVDADTDTKMDGGTLTQIMTVHTEKGD